MKTWTQLKALARRRGLKIRRSGATAFVDRRDGEIAAVQSFASGSDRILRAAIEAVIGAIEP